MVHGFGHGALIKAVARRVGYQPCSPYRAHSLTVETSEMRYADSICDVHARGLDTRGARLSHAARSARSAARPAVESPRRQGAPTVQLTYICTGGLYHSLSKYLRTPMLTFYSAERFTHCNAASKPALCFRFFFQSEQVTTTTTTRAPGEPPLSQTDRI